MPQESLNTRRGVSHSMHGGYIALDIETANLSMKAEGLSFNNPQGWRTACVCVYDGVRDTEHFYVHPDMIDEIDYPTLLHDFNDLSNDLENWFDEGRILVTHNGTGFDNPIISKSIEDGGAGCENILSRFTYERQVDMALTLTDVTGVRYRLQHLIHGLLGMDESKLMQAQFAPIEWNKRNFEGVLQYCIDDCKKTLTVYETAKEKGEFIAVGGRNKYPIVTFDDFENVRLRLKQEQIQTK